MRNRNVSFLDDKIITVQNVNISGKNNHNDEEDAHIYHLHDCLLM